MQAQKVTLACNLKNTFVVKDIKLLESMGYQVLVIYSPAYRDPIRFLLNRVREFFLSLYYLPQSEALFSWFNDYHSSIPLFWARVFKKPATLIVGGYDAVASSKLNYGVFLKKNIRQKKRSMELQSSDEYLGRTQKPSTGVSLRRKGFWSTIRNSVFHPRTQNRNQRSTNGL